MIEKRLIATSVIYNDKLHIPKEIRKEYGLEGKDKIAWYISNEGNIIIEKIENKEKREFITY